MKDSNANLVSQLVDSQPSSWPAMEQYQRRNERHIRESVEATNKKEREDRIKQGLTPPPRRQPRQPRTPQQQGVINNLTRLVSGSAAKKREEDFNKTMDQASKLIERRVLKKKKEQIAGKITQRITQMKEKIKGLSTRAAEIEARKESLRHELDKGDISSSLRARNEARIITDMENQLTRTENMLNATRANINEQRPEGLRKQKEKLQNRRSELVTRSRTMDREQKKKEFKLINEREEQYKDIIIEKKRGPKGTNVKDLIEQYQGAAFTPKKK